MTELIGIVFLLVTGPGALAFGIWLLRSGAWRNSVPLAEAVLDRAFGIEPPPRNKWDRRFAKAQAWFLITLGTCTLLFYSFIFLKDVISE